MNDPAAIVNAPPANDQAAQDRLFDASLAPLESNRAAMAQIARDARVIYQQGGRLTSQQFKVLREEAFYDLAAVCWADRRALTDEIKAICGMSYNALDKAKCPWNAHGPSEKAPIFRWLVIRFAGELAAMKRKVGESRAEVKQEQERDVAKTRRMKAQADREESAAAHDRDHFTAEAEDSARALITAVCTQLRTALLDESPPAIAAATYGKDRSVAEAEIRAYLEGVLSRAVDGAAKASP